MTEVHYTLATKDLDDLAVLRQLPTIEELAEMVALTELLDPTAVVFVIRATDCDGLRELDAAERLELRLVLDDLEGEQLDETAYRHPRHLLAVSIPPEREGSEIEAWALLHHKGVEVRASSLYRASDLDDGEAS